MASLLSSLPSTLQDLVDGGFVFVVTGCCDDDTPIFVDEANVLFLPGFEVVFLIVCRDGHFSERFAEKAGRFSLDYNGSALARTNGL
jgi:hypothetical protein